ncbi:hypothetical protein Pelo_5306 [Pelomyxa schiedti]|nr:hypothetical protein Pelo_5306 [Pelomyxa schiedti]
MTGIRAACCYPLARCIMGRRYAAATAILGAAAALDVADGFVARHFHQTSAIGSIMDPLADKMLMVTTAFCLSRNNIFPKKLTALIAAREVSLICGGALLGLRKARSCRQGTPLQRQVIRIRPSWTGKLSMALQVLLGTSTLISQAAPTSGLRQYLTRCLPLLRLMTGGSVLLSFAEYSKFFVQELLEI